MGVGTTKKKKETPFYWVAGCEQKRHGVTSVTSWVSIYQLFLSPNKAYDCFFDGAGPPVVGRPMKILNES